MNGDDGDFSDPASRAPGARERAAAAAREAAQSQPGAVQRAGATGTLLAFGLPLLILLVVGPATFADWSTAPEIPYQAGIGALSVGRILVSAFGLMFIVLVGAAFISNEGGAWASGMSAATLGLVFAGLLIFSVWLEGSGELRRGVIKVFGKLPAPSPAATAATAPAATAATAPAEPSRAAANCTEAQTLHALTALGCDAALGALTRSALPDLEARNERGLTALALAILNGRHEAARLLLTLGADANAAVRFAPAARPRVSGLEQAQRPELAEGSTPLILAGDQVMTALLLRFGADYRVKNAYGWSALFYYTHHGSVEMIDTLLAAGADINDTANVDPSHAGTTPLMWAAYMNRTAHLQALLKYKPRLDIRDRAGKTALDYARGFGHRDPMRLLETAASAAR